MVGAAPRPDLLLVMQHWGAGGTETFVDALGSWATANGLCVDLALLTAGSDAAAPACAWARQVWPLAAPRRAPGRTGYRLARLVRALAPRVCHLHLYASALPGLVAARLGGAGTVVTTFHMPAWSWRGHHRLAWRVAARASDHVTGVSRAVLESLGVPRDRAGTHVTPPPLRLPAEPAAERPSPGRMPMIAAAGRLVPEKDWPSLVRALAELRQHHGLEATLRLMGEGPEATALDRLARELGVAESFQRLGHVTGRAYYAELAAADLFVLPSRFEGLGIAAVEAMALGVPTITAAFPAAYDFLRPGETGDMVPIGDCRRLAEVMAWHLIHPAESRVMGARARADVRARFAPAAVFQPFAPIYGV